MHGPAMYFSESGATEERTYSDGVCQGPATLRMPDGDTEERMYEGGALHGIATFFSHMGDRLVSKKTFARQIQGRTKNLSSSVMEVPFWLVGFAFVVWVGQWAAENSNMQELILHDCPTIPDCV